VRRETWGSRASSA